MQFSPEKVPVFILAGGLGTRLSEETQLKPKPMVEVGDTPLLLHIMKSYYGHGFRDFVIGGYRSWMIKDFFLTYNFQCNHLEIDHRADANQKPSIIGENHTQEKWRVRVIEAGQSSMTGSRVACAPSLDLANSK